MKNGWHLDLLKVEKDLLPVQCLSQGVSLRRRFTNHGFRKVNGIVSRDGEAKKLATSAAWHASKNGAQLAISHSRKSSGQKGFVALRLACAVT